jgi:hypothetical protein
MGGKMNNEPVGTVIETEEIYGHTFKKRKSKRVQWLKEVDVGTLLYVNQSKEQDGCGHCHACLVGVTEHGLPVTFQRMILCPDCGNKRCPKASNHRHQCTESNEPNQRGSIYTHPVKEELTDEEIISTMVQFDVYSSDDHLLIEAGRAILRKASEK